MRVSDNKAALQYFRKLIDKYQPLTADEEMAMREKMLAEGKESELRDLLVLHNLALVPSAIRKYKYVLRDRADLYMYGVQTLVRCSKTFDLSVGTRFNSYAFDALWRDMPRQIKKWQNEIDKRTFSFDKPIAGDKGDEDSTVLIDIISTHISPDSPYGVSYDIAKDLNFKFLKARISKILKCNGFKPKFINAALAWWTGDGREFAAFCKVHQVNADYFRQKLLKMRKTIVRSTLPIRNEITNLHYPELEEFKLEAPMKPGLVWNPLTQRYDIADVPDTRFFCRYDYDAYRAALDDYWNKKRRAKDAQDTYVRDVINNHQSQKNGWSSCEFSKMVSKIY